MIIRNLLFSSIGLLGIIASVSAQYVVDHQQLFIDPMRKSDTMIYAQALEPFDFGDDKSWLWTGNWFPPMLEMSLLRPLLVKTGPNMPINAPFSIQWAMTYLFPGEQNGEQTDYILDVRDVHHIPSTGQFILCGTFRRNTVREGAAFLLRTDQNGFPQVFKYYPNLSVLDSVVTKSNLKNGFIAVGTTKQSSEDLGAAAAYLSVDLNLDPVCLKQMHGNFKSIGKGRLRSFYKKVIPYGETNFAVVGSTSHSPKDPGLSSQNVLVSTMDEKCNVICNHHFGGRTTKKTSDDGSVQYNQFFETGESLAEVVGKGRGLVVTGNTRRIMSDGQQSRIIFDDILLFRTKPNCKLRFMRRYNINRDRDTGLAVQVRQVDGSRSIVVAGQSRNSYLSDDSSTTKSDDVVLLITKLFNGDLLNLELFGSSGSEGELRGNVDLHFSHNTTEKFPIILANTANSWPKAGMSNPYLIERYDDTKKLCNNYELEIMPRKYKLRRWPASNQLMDPQVEKLELVGRQVELDQRTLCKKTV